jgi:hypothetical protein
MCSMCSGACMLVDVMVFSLPFCPSALLPIWSWYSLSQTRYIIIVYIIIVCIIIAYINRMYHNFIHHNRINHNRITSFTPFTPYTIYHIPYTIYHIPHTTHHIPYIIGDDQADRALLRGVRDGLQDIHTWDCGQTHLQGKCDM